MTRFKIQSDLKAPNTFSNSKRNLLIKYACYFNCQLVKTNTKLLLATSFDVRHWQMKQWKFLVQNYLAYWKAQIIMFLHYPSFDCHHNASRPSLSFPHCPNFNFTKREIKRNKKTRLAPYWDALQHYLSGIMCLLQCSGQIWAGPLFYDKVVVRYDKENSAFWWEMETDWSHGEEGKSVK